MTVKPPKKQVKEKGKPKMHWIQPSLTRQFKMTLLTAGDEVQATITESGGISALIRLLLNDSEVYQRFLKEVKR